MKNKNSNKHKELTSVKHSIKKNLNSIQDIFKNTKLDHENLLNEYKPYLEKNGIIKPSDYESFFHWASITFPREPFSFFRELVKDPNYLKQYHEYKERAFNNLGWNDAKEMQFIRENKTLPHQQTETKPIKYKADEKALAFIFDLWANNKQVPENRIEGGYNAKEIKKIGEEIGFEKPDTFYRAVKKVLTYDLNKTTDLQNISKDWLNAVKHLSNNWIKTEQYLKTNNLIED